MKQFKLNYKSEIEAIADLIDRNIIDEDKNPTEKTIAVVWTGLVVKEIIEDVPTYEDGYFVDLLLKQQEVFPNAFPIANSAFAGLEIDSEEKQTLEMDKAMGQRIVDMFILDNRALSSKMDTPTTVSVAQQFSIIEMIARNGSISAVRDIITNMEANALFTKERKDKYLAVLNEYLKA
jgi:hypothetical protein